MLSTDRDASHQVGRSIYAVVWFVVLFLTPLAWGQRCDQHLVQPQEYAFRHWSAPKTSLAFERVERFAVASYNVLNLDSYAVGHDVRGNPPGPTRRAEKPEAHRREIAEILLRNNAKFIVLQEVEGREVAERFNRDYLHGQYHVFFERGNDSSGIDIAMFVHRSMPFRYEYLTNKDATWSDPTEHYRRGNVFSRDLPVLVVYPKFSRIPLMLLVGGHFKSKRDRRGDPQSRVLAEEQFRRTAKILNDLREDFKGVPIILAADRNRDPKFDQEARLLTSKGNLMDCFDIVKPGLSAEQRQTHSYHPADGVTVGTQSDVILISSNLRRSLDTAYVQPYLDPDGNKLPLPQSFEQRGQQPSDHRAVFAHFWMPELLKIHARNQNRQKAERKQSRRRFRG